MSFYGVFMLKKNKDYLIKNPANFLAGFFFIYFIKRLQIKLNSLC